MELENSPVSESVADHDGGRQKGSADSRAPPRQACIECRRRKIKCSGFGKNGCKTCKVAAVECVFPESQKRGPHKGYFETISTRLSRIERMLQDAIEKQEVEKREASSDDEYAERKRRKSHKMRRPSHERPMSATAALFAPKSATSPDIPFQKFVPQLPLSAAAPTRSSPVDSALGVLAQVAHELDSPKGMCEVVGDYFADPHILPSDLADSLVQTYFNKINPLFPAVNQDLFMSAFRRTPDSGALSDHLAWAVFLAASFFTDDERLREGPYSQSQIEKRLKHACQRELERGHSNLCLIPALILGQLFPAKRERKVALLQWTINGRAVKLALKQKLNVDPKQLEIDAQAVAARVSTWWCVYMVDIWDAARRGRPPSIHEGDYNVPLPTTETTSEEEHYFVRLVHLTKILARVLSFAYNSQSSSALAGAINFATEERIRDLRRQLADWYHAETVPRASLLWHDLQVAYLTVVILLHRPLLPTPLATSFRDPVLLLITKCASQIVTIAHNTSEQVAGSVPWRLFIPAVGYLTAGVTLAQNAVWSAHILGAAPLRRSASRDINVLIEIFDRADAKGHNTAGMSGLLKSIFERSGVDRSMSPDTFVEIPGTGLPLPHENPAFTVNHIRPSSEKAASLPEKRLSGPLLQPLAPLSLPPPRAHTESDASYRKRKHAQISHLSTPTHKSSPQQLPSLSSLTGVDPGRRSPGVRSVHSMSTFSSQSSGSLGKKGYPAPAMAYHPSYATPPEPPRPRQWEQRPHSPSLPPIYDRRYSETSTSYPPSSRDMPSHPPPPPLPPNPYYPPREEYYNRPVSPYPPHEQPPYPSRPEVHRIQTDPRYRHSTPPQSTVTSNSPSWPPGYPYFQRYEPPLPAPPHAHQNRGWSAREDYYYPPPRG